MTLRLKTYKHCWVHLQCIQGGSNMTGTDIARFIHKQSRSYLNYLVVYAGITSIPLVKIKYYVGLHIALRKECFIRFRLHWKYISFILLAQLSAKIRLGNFTDRWEIWECIFCYVTRWGLVNVYRLFESGWWLRNIGNYLRFGMVLCRRRFNLTGRSCKRFAAPPLRNGHRAKGNKIHIQDTQIFQRFAWHSHMYVNYIRHRRKLSTKIWKSAGNNNANVPDMSRYA